MIRCVCVLFLCLVAAISCHAQVITGQITGRITDPSGALVPDAGVTIKNNDTGLERTVATNKEGYYTVPLLPPGRYRISARKEGFRVVTRSEVTLQVDAVARLDFTLEVGAVSDTVEVSGTAVALETESGAIGTVVGARDLVNLPLNSRDAFRLALLTPGVSDTRTGFADAFNGVTQFTVNGGRGWNTDVLIDGVSNVTPGAFMRAYVAMMPTPDSLQEFKMETSAFSSEFGRTGAGVVNMVMKSGTNYFHGSAHDFLRNSALDANNFFSNRAGTPRGSYKRNQYGGTVGGPIKRNNAFFFVSYESLIERPADTRTDTVPTAQQAAGDFSNSFQTVSGKCQPVQIFDPRSTRANPNGGFIRDPFPGNKIPASALDAVGSKAVSYYPLPNIAGAPCTGSNNFFSTMTSPYTTHQIDSKVDWSPTEKDRAFVGLSYFGNQRNRPNHYGTVGDPLGVQLSNETIPAMEGRAGYTHILKPNLVLDFHGGAIRWARNDAPQGFQLGTLGFPANLQSQLSPQSDSFPNFVPTGYSNLGYLWGSVAQFGNSYTIAGNLTWIHGKHNVKVGGEYRINQSFEFTGFNTNGVFNFDRSFTQGPNPNVAAANSGDSIAGLLLGVGSGSIAKLPPVFVSSHYAALFVQDTFKVTSKLTLNLGLRWDLETPRTERHNQLSYFDFNSPSPLAAQVPSLPNLHGGLRFVGVDAANQFKTDHNNFGPRAGLAFAVRRNTIIRAGYGIFYTMFVGGAVGGSAGLDGFQNSTQWVGSVDGLTPVNYLSNAFPNGLLQPSGSALGLNTLVGQPITAQRDGAIERWSPVGYMQSWNLNIQQELPLGIFLQAAYVGSKGTKLAEDVGWELNQLSPQYLALGSALQQLVPNPFYGIIQSGSLAQPTIARGQLLRPYPQFQGVIDYWPASDMSIYHSLQLQLQRQFKGGLGFSFAYAHAKMIDDRGGYQNSYNLRAERSISTDDVPNRVVFSAVYELPVGKGKRLAGNWPTALSSVVGNWQLNAVVTVANGFPLGITAANVAGLYNALERANIAGDVAAVPNGRSIAQWFNTAAFQQPAPFTFGNAGRNLSAIRDDGNKNVDFSLFKQIPWGEARRCELRGEFFNFFNRPQFAAPGTTLGAGTFGVVSAQRNSPRQVQLALKIIF